MMNIKPGSTWQCKSNKELYVVEECRSIKINGFWEENGVILYHGLGSRHSYARLRNDFLSSFLLQKDATSLEKAEVSWWQSVLGLFT